MYRCVELYMGVVLCCIAGRRCIVMCCIAGRVQ